MSGHLGRARRAAVRRKPANRDASVPVTFTRVKRGYYGGPYGQRYTSDKWQCDTCGRFGYGTETKPYEWAKACSRGHSPCRWCGALLTLRMDGTPRVHTRCPERSQDGELTRLLAAEVKHEARLAVRGPFDRQAEALLRRLSASA